MDSTVKMNESLFLVFPTYTKDRDTLMDVKRARDQRQRTKQLKWLCTFVFPSLKRFNFSGLKIESILVIFRSMMKQF